MLKIGNFLKIKKKNEKVSEFFHEYLRVDLVKFKNAYMRPLGGVLY